MIVISNAPSTPTTSYANAGGTGDRTASITVTSNVTWDSGTNSNLVDGGFGDNSTDSVDTPGTGSTSAAGATIDFDFGSAKYIDEVKLYSHDLISPPTNHGAWVFQGSNTSGSGYTTYASFTWDAETKTVTLSSVPAEGYRYWRLAKSGAGNWDNVWFNEVEFKIAPGA